MWLLGAERQRVWLTATTPGMHAITKLACDCDRWHPGSVDGPSIADHAWSLLNDWQKRVSIFLRALSLLFLCTLLYGNGTQSFVQAVS